MSHTPYRFELPKCIDRCLRAVSKLYGHEGKRELQELIVNASVRVHEEWSSDNWNGGTYGHALYLVVPEGLYLRHVKTLDAVQKEIRADINRVHNVQNESIDEVFIEMEDLTDSDWRMESGLVITSRRIVPEQAVSRIWEENCFRLFLSHKSEVKRETAALKLQLRAFGISCFVAHEDIEPTKEWQSEIENALGSMDGFAALLTENFHDSNWTDQEIGFAYGRGVPIVAVRLGRDPYGFVGKYQGLPGTWETAAQRIVPVLLMHERMFAAFVTALRRCQSYDNANLMAVALADVDSLAESQVDEVVAAYNATLELRNSFAFNGKFPGRYGHGLPAILNAKSVRQFRFGRGGLVETIS